MHHKWLLILGIVCAVGTVLAWGSWRLRSTNLATYHVGDHRLQVEVRRTPEELAQGLSGRNQVKGDGMLFVLPTRSKPSFWMKDMQFDLDMIWINEGKVVEITANVPAPPPGTPDRALPAYSPQQVVDHVLEVPAGTAQKRGISPGDQARW